MAEIVKCDPSCPVCGDGEWTNFRGSALIYLSDDGTTYVLDRLPQVGPNVLRDDLSVRDLNIIAALWETFTGRPYR